MTTEDRTNVACPHCGEKEEKPACSVCGKGRQLLFWCENCKQAVAEKRCPLCGLKAKKISR